MKKTLRKLEGELAAALEAVNDAETVVEAASKNLKLASASVVKLQKDEYRAERLFKKASEALVKALNKGDSTDEKHEAANTALAAAKVLQKEVYKAERTFKNAGEVLAKALRKANAADAEYEAAKKAHAAAKKKEAKQQVSEQ